MRDVSTHRTSDHRKKSKKKIDSPEWNGQEWRAPDNNNLNRIPSNCKSMRELYVYDNIPSRIAIFTALVSEVTARCRRNSSPLQGERSASFEYVLLLDVNHGAACRRKPIGPSKESHRAYCYRKQTTRGACELIV
ncbi:uncharacterized protein LOC118439750 [Vespa mandarinia]|uniref:uncharacterized protein LOC118439750 n=1 Tax=Vespa mandarinia TaxID=7446 RepID=UPI00161DC92D|nr:uncharacterized protein LOC118439750 [Vespa mandarinia]